MARHSFPNFQPLQRTELLANQIAVSIRQRILDGDWKPGERIVESRLARELKVGQPTLREALVSLENCGLVTRQTTKGCIVTELSPKQVYDLVAIRQMLESLAIDLICTTATDGELANLEEIANKLVETAYEEGGQFRAQDLLFHQSMWGMTGNEFISRQLEQVTLPLLAFFAAPDWSKLTSAKAHQALATGLSLRDATAAKKTNRILLQAMGEFRLET